MTLVELLRCHGIERFFNGSLTIASPDSGLRLVGNCIYNIMQFNATEQEKVFEMIQIDVAELLAFDRNGELVERVMFHYVMLQLSPGQSFEFSPSLEFRSIHPSGQDRLCKIEPNRN